MNRPINISSLQKQKQHTAVDQRNAEETSSSSERVSLLNREITLFGSMFPDKGKKMFYEELSTLLEAGLDIRSSLQLLYEEQPKKSIKDVLKELLTKITNGSSLSAALRENKLFTPYEYFTVEIGEETGKIAKVLKQLTTYFENKIKQRRLLISALTYPSIVMTIAFGAIFFMMNYVVPMFADVFKRFGGDLPLLTKAVLSFSVFMQHNASKFLLLIVIIVLLVNYYKKKDWYKKYQSQLLLKIPIVKNIVAKIYLSRFASTMTLLLNSKIPLLQSIVLTRQVIDFYPLEQSLSHIENEILVGHPLHQSMQTKKIFPKKMVALVKVGEEVNRLEDFFYSLNEQYTEELEHQTSQIGKFIEPAIILILGVVVGLVLVSMYMPLFSLGTTIK